MDIDDIIGEEEEQNPTNRVDVAGEEIPNMTDDPEKEQTSDEESKDEESTGEESSADSKRVLIGRIEKYFSKINVVAITLVGDLTIGDIIEIEDEDEPIRITVSSMQINKEDVAEASEGDDIGIKVDRPVKEGSEVYKLSE